MTDAELSEAISQVALTLVRLTSLRVGGSCAESPGGHFAVNRAHETASQFFQDLEILKAVRRGGRAR